MSLTVENMEKNMAKLTIEVSAEEFEKAVEQAYRKNKGKMSIPGFRKGKVPRQMLEKMYGAGIFYEDAANIIIPEAYANEVENCDLDIVSRPEIAVEQIEAGKPFIFTATVAVKPEVTLGQYTGIEVDKVEVEVTEDEITAELEKVREQNSRTIPVEDRAVQDGDIANIDYEGSVDGVPFEGGKAENHNLTIGSHSFIDTFEEQLIGKNIGDEVEVNVTFPEEYHAEELKGKPAVFKVKINEIKAKELPELDDDFAQDVSEFDTMDEYKADVKAKLQQAKENDAKTKKEEAIVDAIIENATMEIPDAMINTQAAQMADDFARRMQSQGLSIEQYFQFTGMDADKFIEQMKPQAEKRIQARLVLEAIVKAENIEAADADVEKEIENMASMYQMEVDKLKELVSDTEKEQMKQDICVRKAVEFVVSKAVEK